MGIVLAQDDLLGGGSGSKGSILSAFFIGYFFTQIPGGILASRWGAKPTLLLAALTWTTFDILTPFAAHYGFAPLILSRVGMGLGEGLMFPTQHALANFWVPTQERAFLVTFMTSGQDLGSVLANIISPWLLERSVLTVFVFWGILAIAWAVVYFTFAASAPELHKACTQSGEAEWIQQRRGARHFSQVKSAPIDPFPRNLLCAPCVWAIFIGHMGVNYAWYVVLSWLPSFFSQRFDIVLAENPLMLSAPYLAAWVGGLFAGRCSDALVARGVRTKVVRKAAQLLGALGIAIFLQLAARSQDPGWAAVWLSTALFFGKWQNAGYWVNMVDVCPLRAGTLMGLSNMVATIPGIVGQPVTQAILNSSGSWAVVFGVGGTIGILAAFVFLAFGDDVSLDVCAEEDVSCEVSPRL